MNIGNIVKKNYPSKKNNYSKRVVFHKFSYKKSIESRHHEQHETGFTTRKLEKVFVQEEQIPFLLL